MLAPSCHVEGTRIDPCDNFFVVIVASSDGCCSATTGKGTVVATTAAPIHSLRVGAANDDATEMVVKKVSASISNLRAEGFLSQTASWATTAPREPHTLMMMPMLLLLLVGVVGGFSPSAATKQWYINLTGFPFPLGPLVARRTEMSEIVPGRVWGFEQEQSLLGIRTNTRMVAVKMRSGDLWVYNPVAPTRELVELVEGLGGGVAHVVLGTTQYEHKIFVGPFARKFPEATVHCVPDQWSFPIDLPPRLLGIPTTRQEKRAGPGVLENPEAEYGWGDEFEFRLLRPDRRLAANYAAVEAAFLHRDTKTLVLTDALVNVPKTPPKVLDRDALDSFSRPDTWVIRAAALFNWRGRAEDLRSAGPTEQQSGWQRNALLSLTFGPSPDSLIDPKPAFDLIADKWLVAPVCTSLVYASDVVRPALREWVDQVAQLDFVRVVPSHFAAAKCTPAQFKRAFEPVFATKDEKRESQNGLLKLIRGGHDDQTSSSFTKSDVQLIDDLAAQLKRLRVI